MFDYYVPDAQTATEPPTSHTKDTIYLINSNYLKLVVDRETDFVPTDFVKPENQDCKVAQILWMGQIVCSNRARQAVNGNITLNLTS